MRFWDGITITAHSLNVHKTRALLASLGVMIGIASVIIMVAIGKGSQKEVMDIISDMGENLVTVNAGEMKRRGGKLRLTGKVNTLTDRDADFLLNEIDYLVKAAPYEYKELKIKFGNSSTQVTVAGTSPDFLSIRKYAIREGRFFNIKDLKQSRRMAVIGKTTVKNIFGDENPLGQVLRIGNIPFTVEGIFQEKGMDTDGVDQDDILVIPLNTLLRRILNQNFITTIYFQVDEKKNIDRAVAQVRDRLRERHKLRGETEDDFSIQTQLELEELKKETSEMFTSLIVGVAAISLVVGGIGIMAVMLISVKERTREIGVRRAVGATRTDIVQQFIMESVVIGFLGGGIGIILGVGITLGLAKWSPWSLVMNIPSIVISTGVCVLIGMVFGIFPAFKASRLDPMAALKIE